MGMVSFSPLDREPLFLKPQCPLFHLVRARRTALRIALSSTVFVTTAIESPMKCASSTVPTSPLTSRSKPYEPSFLRTNRLTS